VTGFGNLNGGRYTKDPVKSIETIGHRINTVTVEP
jgi:hypothetical protein